MTVPTGLRYRALVVEDDVEIAKQVLEAIPSFVTAPDTLEVEAVTSFEEAKERLLNGRFDLLILDLHKDAASDTVKDDVSAGLEILEILKRSRFLPVIFYTAHAHKVRDLATPFVRVAEKSEGLEKLQAEVAGAIGTGLPALAKHLEELEREFLWEVVGARWKEFVGGDGAPDLPYLLARRISRGLEASGKLAAKAAGAGGEVPKDEMLHPVEMYVYPSLGGKRRSGDILKGKIGDHEGYWVVLTPSCDFEDGRKPLDRVLIAPCVPFDGIPEYAAWKADPEKGVQSLKDVIKNRGTKTRQEGRYRFLPGTFFLPDLVVDFQGVVTAQKSMFDTLSPVCSLDSPFAEALLSAFNRFFGRVGTPDLDVEVVLARLSS